MRTATGHSTTVIWLSQQPFKQTIDQISFNKFIMHFLKDMQSWLNPDFVLEKQNEFHVNVSPGLHRTKRRVIWSVTSKLLKVTNRCEEYTRKSTFQSPRHVL